MQIATVFLLALALGINGLDHGDYHKPGYRMPVNPVPYLKTMKPHMLGKEYESLRHHNIMARDHGCKELPDDIDESYACVYIPLKNRYSAAGVRPSEFLTEFQYHGTHHSWTPVVTWIERLEAKVVRACAASVPGKKDILSEGKIRWLALYNYTQTATEQSGVKTFADLQNQQVFNLPFTANKHCFLLNFPRAFASKPSLKFTLKLNNGYHSAQDALVIWAKGESSLSSAYVCLEEFHAWARYHTHYEIHWYGISANHAQDDFSTKGILTFKANDVTLPNHASMLHHYCQNFTLPQTYYPCQAMLLQACEPSSAVCESALVAWVAYTKDNMATVCYADRRGIVPRRPVDVEVHYIIYGLPDKCVGFSCDNNRECIHPTYDTVKCGCIKSCPQNEDKVCGTNMKTYKNRCMLDKEACESGDKFTYAHKGPCEKYTYDHGRTHLQSVSSCDGLYCAQVSTRNNIWYEHADINVQISVSWGGNTMGLPHDPSSSWVEDVKPTGFRACVMQAGRETLQNGPIINWFAYQGEMEKVKSHKIEVGEWHSGTHCVPIHERKHLVKPSEFKPNVCPKISLKDIGKVDKDQWSYDAHLMSQIYGKHHTEWFKRMMMGYGIEKLKLTHGMEVMGLTLMLTVEHTKHTKSHENKQDAVNAWMEFDAKSKEAYICLREMQNWDGNHEGINVHWTLFNGTKIHNLGFGHKIYFKPSKKASASMSHKAICQSKKYLPDDMNLIPGTGATVLVSLGHKIAVHSALDSMKKYELHQKEVKMGMNMGDADFDKKDVRESWMFPHLWRANLTGWRPHMRIGRDTDYSAWVEGMNSTHVQVCQRSLNAAGHNEGVAVSVFILPDRCPSGYRFFKGGYCGKYMPVCKNVQDAATQCSAEGAFLAAPEECRDSVWTAYLAGQREIHIALSDAAKEQTWVRGYGNPSPSTYFHWAANEPRSNPDQQNNIDILDCAYQKGRIGNFVWHSQHCSSCKSYVCVKSAPWLSCGFRNPDYCNNCGTCNKVVPFQFSCNCIPPYTGGRCETRRLEADQ